MKIGDAAAAEQVDLRVRADVGAACDRVWWDVDDGRKLTVGRRGGEGGQQRGGD